MQAPSASLLQHLRVHYGRRSTTRAEIWPFGASLKVCKQRAVATPLVGAGASQWGTSLPFRVTLDDQPLGANHGDDADEQGNGMLSDQRTYHLIRQRGPVGERTATIEFLEAGAEAYCFTFG